MKNNKEISGVYETLRSFGGKFVFLEKHEARMQRSCTELGLRVPDLREITARFSSEIGPEGKPSGKDVRLRVAVDAEGNGDGEVEVKHFDLALWHGSFLYDEVWRVKVFDGAREHPELKSTDTNMQVAAREAAAAEGYGEVLLMDQDGYITEGGITNVWFVETGPDGGRLVTPDTGMLPGIARGLILEACEALGIEVVKRAVCADELANFDTVFLSNSIRGIIATEAGPDGEPKVPAVMKRVVDWCTDYVQRRINQQKDAA